MNFFISLPLSFSSAHTRRAHVAAENQHQQASERAAAVGQAHTGTRTRSAGERTRLRPHKTQNAACTTAAGGECVANEASAHSGGVGERAACSSARSGGRRAVETTGFFPTVKSPFLRASVQGPTSFAGNGFLCFSSFFLIN